MTTTKMLQLICSENDTQKRLALLVQHGFIAEAGWLIRRLACTNTIMFHYDWHERDFPAPLPRVKDGIPGVYVAITSGSKLDLDRGQRLIIFELGWERKVLGWTEEESLELARHILAHALARPINQWSFKQAEGSARAARQLFSTRPLSAADPLAKETAAWHLVFQLRQADFGRICNYLAEVEGFPFTAGKQVDAEKVVTWITQKLSELGWTRNQICKELAEWISLKKDVYTQWLVAVVKADIFYLRDPLRTAAVRKWIVEQFDRIFTGGYAGGGSGAEAWFAEMYRYLLKIAEFGHEDSEWIAEKLAQQMASGSIDATRWFIDQFTEIFGNACGFTLREIRERAVEIAMARKEYSVTLLLIEDSGEDPDPELVETERAMTLLTPDSE